MSHTPLGHLSGWLKLAGRRIIELGRPEEILVTAHATSNENFPVGKESGGLSRAWLEHRRGGRDRLHARCSRTKCCIRDRKTDGETESDTSNEQQAGPVHGILVEK